MFEENRNNIEQDQIFRSILEEGMEPAPAHVWDRIEADLDRIAQRRRAVLWFRRTAVGVAAAAALAAGVFLNWNGSEDVVSPAAEGMIAVVEKEAAEEAVAQTPELLAMADMTLTSDRKAGKGAKAKTGMKAEAVTATEEETASLEEAAPRPEDNGKPEQKASGKSAEDSRPEGYSYDGGFDDSWQEEAPSKGRNGISLTVSGITGTNSAQNSARVNPMRRPGVSSDPVRTGIKETSTNTTYGIPVSAGIGVRIDLAPRWSIGTGINYTLLSRKFYGTYTLVGDKGNIIKDISSDICGNQHYIGIPVNVYYDVVNSEKISFYAYAGGTAEKCVADKYHVLNTDITHTEKVKGIQLSADIGMGVEFLVGKHLGIYIDPSLRYYFDNNQPKSIRTAQPLMFGFEMGLRARL